ncbi:MAG: aspartyl/glutamyl-tRNA(Asn/Gln) amidotransferase subunit B [Deltaproteobacteria bacterium]|jgi:aspartyl-tRNA(Asn)/glutamyl-tRNA(Gln) amidotransferase subunit B|nr:MAG: aspartyl/glutamyl-tRNA(Asn/Gln) amidotransferase subunit B [Deltaproteobacteria bacterium]
MEYEAIIGLEVHAQLLTESKIFCSCSTKFGARPNSQVCPVCLGMPGVLPVLNRKALEYAIRAAVAMNCEISPRSRFARKNYFYPDLPKGYQISQYEEPLSKNGWLEIETNGTRKRVRIRRIHLEEDAGKLIHEYSKDWSYVDLNRAGVPLIEIVSEPDISSPEEAVSYLKKLRSILMYIGVCDGNMEEGSLRCDANVSVRPKGSKELGTKTEIKNVNSFKFVQKALEYEIRRQIAVLESGEKVTQETRLFDSNRGVTFSMRSKEEAHDYRYFPDPDLLPVVIDEEWIKEIKNTLPELPDARKERFINQYGIPSYDAEILTSSREIADYFEECVRHYGKPKTVSNWIMTEVLRELKGEEDITSFPVTPEKLAELLKLVDNGTISGKIAKDVFSEMVVTGKRAIDIVEEKGIRQISDEAEIERIISQVIENNPNEVARYKAGQEKLLGFFVGEVMKATKGKANPRLVNEILRKRLSQ